MERRIEGGGLVFVGCMFLGGGWGPVRECPNWMAHRNGCWISWDGFNETDQKVI
ncbi:hypothetical protein ACT7CZ_20330 [Bacillus cereus]